MTFTLAVPLAEVVCGHAVLVTYCEEAFEGDVRVCDAEFRVVGEASANDDFDQGFSGRLNYQVTCWLEEDE